MFKWLRKWNLVTNDDLARERSFREEYYEKEIGSLRTQLDQLLLARAGYERGEVVSLKTDTPDRTFVIRDVFIENREIKYKVTNVSRDKTYNVNEFMIDKERGDE